MIIEPLADHITIIRAVIELFPLQVERGVGDEAFFPTFTP